MDARVLHHEITEGPLPQWVMWRAVANTLSWYDDAMFDIAPPEVVPAAIEAPVLLARGTWTAPWLRAVVDVLAAELPRAQVLELDGGHACCRAPPPAPARRPHGPARG